MKLIHCADIHLDSKMETNLSREQAKERRSEILETFERMIQYACDQQVSAIMIAGDLFDTTEIEQKNIKRRVADLIRNHPNLDFFYLQGNHDRSGFLSHCGEKPENLYTFSTDFTSYQYKEVVITGREFGRTKEDGMFDDLLLREEDVNIVMLHGQESQYAQKSNAEIISMNQLKEKYIDYLALGHIHTYKQEHIDKRGVYCYSGCLEGRGFDECGEKGFVEITVENKKVSAAFHPFAKRTLHEVWVNADLLKDENEIIQAINQAISLIPAKDLVKVVLCGETDTDMDIDPEYLLRKIEDRFYYAKLQNATKLRINYEDYANEVSLKGEFVRGVWNSELSENEKAQVVLTGIKALMGRELLL